MKKYKIKQRFPNFYSGFIPEEIEFDTVEELYNIEFIKNLIKNSKFKKFEISSRKSNQQILMVYMDDESHRAVGFLTNAQNLELFPIKKISTEKKVKIWINKLINKIYGIKK